MKKKSLSTLAALTLCLALITPIITPIELCDCGYDVPPHTEEDCPYKELPLDDPNPPKDEQ